MNVPPVNIVLGQLWLNSSIWLKDACYNLICKLQFYCVAKKKNVPAVCSCVDPLDQHFIKLEVELVSYSLHVKIYLCILIKLYRNLKLANMFSVKAKLNGCNMSWILHVCRMRKLKLVISVSFL